MTTRTSLASPGKFTFEDITIPFRPGETVGSALLNAGILHLRTAENGDARGLLCGIGVCWECRCVVDGKPNVRACMTVLQDGMAVRRQQGLL
ncbi:(2Fe-2S)-binding protein [Mesorhizobium sp.]|uniref:(2Fe-2S)-binding protein n=1 Tax=Mesorhizobium sp. TaxID=1871066 RepID=UPI000FE94E87|nr:(2Fe-2S)-binding protein [Mesorhizobium sp.]RWB66302.1 MAG: (2Fe-2S)-binding protein [Mesorhizobium sp.]